MINVYFWKCELRQAQIKRYYFTAKKFCLTLTDEAVNKVAYRGSDACETWKHCNYYKNALFF